jgi:hypothetical protein
MSGWSSDPDFWVSKLHRETDIKKLNWEVCNCMFGHDYGPRFWHAWLQIHGMVYDKVDVTDRYYYVREMYGTYRDEDNYGIWYRGVDRIQVVVSISEKNNDYLQMKDFLVRFLYLRGAQELPAIYFYLDGHKICQWNNAVENELFQAIEAAVNPKFLPLCINMIWAKDLAARYMEVA